LSYLRDKNKKTALEGGLIVNSGTGDRVVQYKRLVTWRRDFSSRKRASKAALEHIEFAGNKKGSIAADLEIWNGVWWYLNNIATKGW